MPTPSFTDWMLATRPKSLADPAKIKVQSTRRQRYLLRDILSGLAPKKYIQSGSKIIDFIQLKATASFKRYLPTDGYTYTPSNTLTQIEVPWRFSSVDMSWTDHEVILNGTDILSTFQRVKAAKESAMMVDFYEGMEDDLWATPNVTEMEATPSSLGRQPLSLRCFVTDDGLAPSSTNGGVVGDNWTTIQTVNPTTETNWRNQVETYDGTSLATGDADSGGIISAFDGMWMSLGWQSPETSQKYVEDISYSKLNILASKKAVQRLIAICRLQNDRLTPGGGNLQHAGGQITYGNIPVKYITELDVVDATADAANKPKFRWFNFNHIKPIFHSQRYLYQVSVGKNPAQPHQSVEVRDTWRNLFCINRRAQGMVRSAA